MQGFEVDPSTLVDEARSLDAVVSGVASGRLQGVRTGPTGVGELDRAIGSFTQAWQEGLQVMLEDASDLTDGMRAAARRYLDLDAAAAERLRSQQPER